MGHFLCLHNQQLTWNMPNCCMWTAKRVVQFRNIHVTTGRNSQCPIWHPVDAKHTVFVQQACACQVHLSWCSNGCSCKFDAPCWKPRTMWVVCKWKSSFEFSWSKSCLICRFWRMTHPKTLRLILLSTMQNVSARIAPWLVSQTWTHICSDSRSRTRCPPFAHLAEALKQLLVASWHHLRVLMNEITNSSSVDLFNDRPCEDSSQTGDPLVLQRGSSETFFWDFRHKGLKLISIAIRTKPVVSVTIFFNAEIWGHWCLCFADWSEKLKPAQLNLVTVSWSVHANHAWINREAMCLHSICRMTWSWGFPKEPVVQNFGMSSLSENNMCQVI